jgi:hypothetical protein
VKEAFFVRRKNGRIFAGLVLAAVFLFAAVAVQAAPIEPPIAVTTCGQSPGAVMVKMSCAQAKLMPTDSDNKLTADGLRGKGYKTLIITTGTSMKGMGAAGTDVNKEIARIEELVKAAREEGMLVVGAHVEGMARRTDASDEASIKAVMPLSDLILIIEDSDKDGFFTAYAKELNKPLVVVKDALGIGAALAELK